MTPPVPGTSRRTKIVCTLGPASSTEETLRDMIAAGMNVARVNCSHGTRKSHATAIALIRHVADDLNISIPVLLDLAGPKMRIGKINRGAVSLRAGEEFSLTLDDVAGDHKQVSVTHKGLVEDVAAGDRVLMGDGEIELKVIETDGTRVRCEIVVGGLLKSNKGINAPGVKLRGGVPTEKDLDDVAFGVEQGVDWFAMSFVRSRAEVEKLRAVLDDHGADIPIVAKIEKREALDEIDGILDAADAIMVARGDLGLDMPIEQVPLIQKDLVDKAVRADKPVVVATQMLESMVVNPRPTRAEAGDVANAVLDGTDAVMLSAETAAGKHPVKAVRVMAEVAAASEHRIDYAGLFEARPIRHDRSIALAISRAACYTAIETGAKVIICCTRSGQTARYVSSFRPPAKIAVVSPYPETLRRTMLYWNTHPISAEVELDTNAMIAAAKEGVVEAGLASPGERVVIVAGVPVNVPGSTNMIKADTL